MKLDNDLVREILLQIEASPHPDPRSEVDITIAGHSEADIAHHILLLDEAGFVEANHYSSSSGHDCRAKRLTYEGHEFLNTVRDAAAWRYTKETAKTIGISSVKTLYEISKSYAKQKLIEHGIYLP